MGRMDRRLTYPIGLVAGVVLAFLAVTAMGLLAAIPTPPVVHLDARAHPVLAFLVSMTLLVHVPAAILAQAGADLLTISKLLGHADTRITARHYAHLCDKTLANTVDKLMPNFGFKPEDKVADLGCASR
jgi:hypothetical protein